ncbi:hypothetical protein HS1genome_1767 [Sulfodiicoccus acidiphilus]|uniref:CRISPR type III-associated protein domain-containing protein n=1 Tax=Sulfodiicoccus acidiphilus TaxID=1670455 RepID=A0A348B5C6_9CREN|nr:RAMP superfamily CRISPR-associated protein [Sulfodiicoccus acidiphilus]BBD73378.1 hypothetical protein HS1genome_1767 [Sulfodiicoccus acidiphilus]GGU01007.1 hypothetical protein GCM10007116_17870 [Sulfodiicoccus acidiphilus]
MRFVVTVRNLSSLTLGGSAVVSHVDVPMNQLGFPPSSLKGVMRTAATVAVREGLARGFTACGEVEPTYLGIAHSDGPCDVCRLFGYPGSMGSKVVVRLTRGEAPTFTLTRVSIDDGSGTAEEGKLFTQEVYSPGTQFTFEVDLLSQDARLRKLLLYSMAVLRTWRVGRNSLVDLRLEGVVNGGNLVPLCQAVKCDGEETELQEALKEWMWEV